MQKANVLLNFLNFSKLTEAQQETTPDHGLITKVYKYLRKGGQVVNSNGRQESLPESQKQS